MEKSSYADTYKILKILRKKEDGVSVKQLKLRLPFLKVNDLLEKLTHLGYITNRITGYKVKVRSSTEIKHNSDHLWYLTPLGEQALDQFLENNPPKDYKLWIVLGAVIAACVIIFWLIFNK